MDIKDILAKRAQVWDGMKAIHEKVASESRTALSAEEEQEWERRETELKDLDGLLERQRTLDESERRAAREVTPPTEDGQPQVEDRKAQYEKAFRSYLRDGPNDMEPEERKVLRDGFVQDKELRAQGVASGAVGGFFIPQGFRDKIQEAQKEFGSVQSVAEVINTDTGADLPWPTNDDTANKGAILSENTQVTEQDVVLGQKTLKAYMYTSKLVRVSLQLLQDSAFDLESWLGRKLGERLGRAMNEHFTTGTGTAQPEGVQTFSPTRVTGAVGQTVTVIYNNLVDLIHSIDPAYRASGRSRFMTKDASIAVIRKIRDDSGGAGLGRPIWEPSVQVGSPDSLLGYPITVNQDMPVMAANAKSILFGDFFAGYVVRFVNGQIMLRLTERYADFLQVGFLDFQRADGMGQDADALAAYANSAT